MDAQYRWSWTYWERVLAPLVREIGALSLLASALVNPATTVVLPTSDPTVQAISRRGAGGEVWVIAARSGEGAQDVSIGGLPPARGSPRPTPRVAQLQRPAASLLNMPGRWDVHVYRLAAA